MHARHLNPIIWRFTCTRATNQRVEKGTLLEYQIGDIICDALSSVKATWRSGIKDVIEYWLNTMWMWLICYWTLIQWPASWNYKKNKRHGVLLWITWFTIHDILFLREIKLNIFWCKLLVPVNGERTLLLMVNCASEVLCSSIGANSLNLLFLAQDLLLRMTVPSSFCARLKPFHTSYDQIIPR